MAFKCEICKERDAKRQYIGSVLNGEPEKELYICNECYEKLTPALTWKSLGPLLTLQQKLVETSMSLKSVVSTVLAAVTLKIHDKIINKLSKTMPDFYKRDMTMLLYIANKKTGKSQLHAMSFCKPYMNESIKIFPFMFDGEVVNVYMSIDPDNERNLMNLVLPETKKHFSPAFNYIGVGVDYGAFDIVDFFDCLLRAVDLIDSFADESKNTTPKRATEEMIEKFLKGDLTEEDIKPKRKRRAKKFSDDEKESLAKKTEKKKPTKKTSKTKSSSTIKKSNPKKNKSRDDEQ